MPCAMAFAWITDGQAGPKRGKQSLRSVGCKRFGRQTLRLVLDHRLRRQITNIVELVKRPRATVRHRRVRVADGLAAPRAIKPSSSRLSIGGCDGTGCRTASGGFAIGLSFTLPPGLVAPFRLPPGSRRRNGPHPLRNCFRISRVGVSSRYHHGPLPQRTRLGRRVAVQRRLTVMRKKDRGPQMLDWDDLRFFLALARRGNLSEAARDLHVAQSTMGRRLASLEASLGVRLLNRNTGPIHPDPGWRRRARTRRAPGAGGRGAGARCGWA